MLKLVEFGFIHAKQDRECVQVLLVEPVSVYSEFVEGTRCLVAAFAN